MGYHYSVLWTPTERSAAKRSASMRAFWGCRVHLQHVVCSYIINDHLEFINFLFSSLDLIIFIYLHIKRGSDFEFINCHDDISARLNIAKSEVQATSARAWHVWGRNAAQLNPTQWLVHFADAYGWILLCVVSWCFFVALLLLSFAAIICSNICVIFLQIFYFE